MTDQDRCTDTNPHPAHRTQYGGFGTKDCPGVPMPRTVPSPEHTAARTFAIEELRAERVETGRLEGDLRSQTRAVRELTAERDALRAQLDAMKAAKKRVLGRLEKAEHVIDLIRDGQEQIDRALATYDTTPGEEEADAEARAGEQPDWSHEIAFDDDGDWSIGHPDGCPGQQLFGDCPVGRLARMNPPVSGMRGPRRALAGRRYECAVNDLGDQFLLGDRIEAREAPHPPAEMVWLGDLSGYWIEAPDHEHPLLRHRCGWAHEITSPVRGYLANLLTGPVEAHRDAGCNPHEG